MNDRIHPAFRPALQTIFHEEQKFDEWDNELFQDLCGKRQGPVIQDLLILLSQVDATEASFGVNGDRFMKMAVPMLQKLREACLDDFKEL